MALRRIYLVLAGLNLANGLWMLVGPESWYLRLPAAVPDTGPFNPHFVRDIGAVFTVVAIGFAWCSANVDRCLPVHWGITLFFIGHAAIHVADILAGRLPHSHWGIDTPAVFLPPFLLVAMAFPPLRPAVTGRASEP
jgi:hypothetical protein